MNPSDDPLSAEAPEHRMREAAMAAQASAYAPYSKFHVGAALALSDGTLIPGCNVENASYGLTVCAERTAIFAAIALGRRDFQSMAVIGPTPEPITPCGACRQVLFEFAPDMPLLLLNNDGARRTVLVRDLLPDGFGPSTLSGKLS